MDYHCRKHRARCDSVAHAADCSFLLCEENESEIHQGQKNIIADSGWSSREEYEDQEVFTGNQRFEMSFKNRQL